MENNVSSSEILRWAKGKNGFNLLLDTDYEHIPISAGNGIQSIGYY